MTNNYPFDLDDAAPGANQLSELCLQNNHIPADLYNKYEVKRGLREPNGKGVLTGLTEISEINAFEKIDGQDVPCDGKLYYRGIDIEELVSGFVRDRQFGFEETTYLLLFGELPSSKQLANFNDLLAGYRQLPTTFVRDIIMKAPSFDMMNTLARSVLTLYTYDAKIADRSIGNILRQCLALIAQFPLLAVYSYQAHDHYNNGNSLFIHTPQAELSTAENILYTLRSDCKYSELEARILDIALVLHAEHGGGNNSSFTTHVVASSGTDTYSVIAAALSSLKGPKHGGANAKVVEMFRDLQQNVRNWEDEQEVAAYLNALLDKKAYDRAGLIYGMGHAVYTQSDPRARVLNSFVKRLSDEKGLQKEYQLYTLVERLAPEIIAAKRNTQKRVSANIDFYSGFVYSMLDLPTELYTPIFAIARIAGWSAHMIEEIINGGKIIRPAYKCVSARREYVAINERD